MKTPRIFAVRCGRGSGGRGGRSGMWQQRPRLDLRDDAAMDEFLLADGAPQGRLNQEEAYKGTS
ncbi:MAG: hypothetical protein ACLU48_04515 [Clostridiaceae bacterium]